MKKIMTLLVVLVVTCIFSTSVSANASRNRGVSNSSQGIAKDNCIKTIKSEINNQPINILDNQSDDNVDDTLQNVVTNCPNGYECINKDCVNNDCTGLNNTNKYGDCINSNQNHNKGKNGRYHN